MFAAFDSPELFVFVGLLMMLVSSLALFVAFHIRSWFYHGDPSDFLPLSSDQR
jgi:hypothetical protein